MAQKVAILGANGFIGLPVADAFEANGWEVVCFTRSLTHSNKRQEFFTDLFDERTLKSALLLSKPDLVISTAWDTEHGKFWTNKSNVDYRDATLKFAELSFQCNVETFVGLGTMSEYGNSPGNCYAEFSPLIEEDVYSKSKIETGLQLRAIGERFGCKTHWTRIFQAFGPNEKIERFIPGLIASLRNNEKFLIRTPDYEMDWIHTADIASAIVFTIENNLDHFVDIGTGVGTSVKELSELICREFGFDVAYLDYSDQVEGHQKKAVADRRSQLLSLGWGPAESLRNRIRSLR